MPIGSQRGDADLEGGETGRADVVASAGAFDLALNQSCLAQNAEMFGDGRLREGEFGDDIAGNACLPFIEDPQDLYPGGVQRHLGRSAGEANRSSRGRSVA